LKAAQLSAVNQIRAVHIPIIEVRQWRALIAFRQQLGRRRGRIKNNIRDLLVMEGEILPRGAKGWALVGVGALWGVAQHLAEASMKELWRGALEIELRQLRDVQVELEQAEAKLDAIAKLDPRVALLRTIPGVGPRLAEAIVALLDQPERFQHAREVSAYVGM